MKSYFTNTGIILRVMLLFVWIMPFRSQGAENPMAAAPPTWSVNPLDFEFNMNILIQVQYNGVDNNNPNNIVGVFVGNELRGVATPTMAGGIAYYFVKVYSNTYSGENLNFKVYYAPDDQVYQTMETANFLHNGSIGDINNPFYLDINPNMDLPPELAPFDEVTTLDNIPFDPIALNDYLISADGDPVTWSVQSGPNFTAIIVNDVLTVSHVPGTLMLPYSEDVVITATENNPPNNFSVSATVQFTVLEDYGPPEWEVTPDNIPDQTIFKGDQFSNFDLDNHLNYAGPCHEFDFDVFPYAGSDPDPAWPVVPPGANPMTVIARPLFADVQLAGPGAKLAAFVGGNLAGWADVQGFSPNVHYDLQLANVGSGPITFRLYHADNQFLYEKQSTLNYTSGGTTGSIANPYKVQYSPLVPLLNSSGQVLISIVDTSWLGSYPVDFIVWDCDYPVQRRATDQAVFTIVADARPVFTSENSKNYQENACYVLYDAETADPNYNEGNGLTYSLDGGADIARFEIDPTTGILSWVTGFIPDFETPQDDDLNNKYQVNIKVTNDDNLSATLALTITVTDQATEPFVAMINNGDPLICNTGGATLTASGGVAYSWSTGSMFNSIDVPAGDYTVTVTSAGACTLTASVTVADEPSIIAAGNNNTLCIGAAIQLSSTPAGGTQPYASFAWTGPDNFASSQEDPAGFPATLAAAGDYVVVVTDDAGCSVSASKTIDVSNNTQPAITASVAADPVCQDSPVNLSSDPMGGSGIYTQFNWSGPNGYLGVVQNPPAFNATLLSAGTYQVIVTDDQGCKGTATVSLSVNEQPMLVVDNGLPLDSISEGQNLDLTATASGGSGSGYIYSWTGPAGFSSSDQNPSRLNLDLTHSGLYIATVTDGNGCTRSDTTEVTVMPCPGVTATPGPVCVGGDIDLNSFPTSGALPYTAFSWEGPNGYSSDLQDPAAFPISPANLGTYTVTVTDHLGCTATSSTTAEEHVNPSITATNSTLPSGICEGEIVSLFSTPSGGSGLYPTFDWVGVDGYVASIEDPASFTTSLASAGLYQVKVTDSQGCTATATTTVIVNGNPTITASSNSTVCLGQDLDLQSDPQGGATPYTFDWTGPTGFSGMVQNPSRSAPLALPDAGIYSVTLTDMNGCSATASTPVSVSATAAPDVMASSNSPVCSGDALMLSATATGGSGVYTSYIWEGPANYSASVQNPVRSPAYKSEAGGSYTVTVTDSHNCNASASVTVMIDGPDLNPSNNGPLCIEEDVVLMAGGSGGAGWTYSWVGPNGFSSNQQNPAPFPATLVAAGDYTVTVTADDGGCTGSVNVDFTSVEIAGGDPPVIVCPPDATVTADANCSGEVGEYDPISVTDDCPDNLTVTQSPDPNTMFSGLNQVQTISLTADDGAGNTASCAFNVTLEDQSAPAITCPANTTVSADANCGGELGAYDPESLSDNCDANPVVTQNPDSNTMFSGLGDVQTITLTAEDASSNTSSCSFTATLEDTTPPDITCPADITIFADANCSGTLDNYSPVTLSDNCSANPTVTQSPAAGTMLSGHNDSELVTLTADDGNGNASSCDFTVTLIDDTPPMITCPTDATVSADANCSGVVGSYSPASVSDNCNANPTVTQSPDPSTPLMGHNDFQIVTLTADDGNGNSASCDFTVTLIDDTPPVITCPADVTLSADANCSGVVGSYSPVTVSDNCSANPTVTQSPDPSTPLMGHNDSEVVTLTADDGNGNSASCDFTVTLIDDTPPVITCPADVTLSADANCSGVVGPYSPASVSDNCNTNPTVTQSPDPSTPLMGHNDSEVVTLTADDGNGNSASCDFTVTLIDDTPPV
ncbi:MAG: HYR domain-containing protein, partial [Saprospiraceae bacterium]|nr:HYR domain-containing protein [Saprospiraceae bacterium]